MSLFESCFSVIPDPRAANVQHDLQEILFIALACMLCGGDSCSDMADFGRAKEDALREILTLRNGIPSHDTFSAVFRVLDPNAFEDAFDRFATDISKGLPKGVIALDGKALRGAFEKGRRHAPQVMVSAWASEARMILGVKQAPTGEETKAVLALLQRIDVTDTIVTADALHCTTTMAQTVLSRGGDYALCLKGNRSTLQAAVNSAFEMAGDLPSLESVEQGHGRRETRRSSVLAVEGMAESFEFAGLKAVGRIESTRELGNGKIEQATRTFVLSRVLSPTRLLAVVRKHWQVENNVHWVLDVTFNEDLVRTRKDHGAQNMAILRRLALNILKRNPEKGSIRSKTKRAGWNNAFLFSLFRHMR